MEKKTEDMKKVDNKTSDKKSMGKKIIIGVSVVAVAFVAGMSSSMLFFNKSNANEIPSTSSVEQTKQSTDTASTAQTIGYPQGYDTTSQGASSLYGKGDHDNSPYFPAIDYFNAQSTEALSIIPEFKTYQQTTEVTCGPASALMVLYHYGETKYDELQVAEIMQCHKDTNGNNTENPGVANERGEIGTSTDKMVKFFEDIGWEVTSSLTKANEDGYSFTDYNDFKDFVIKNVKEDTPIMVEWITWAGHWANIIGYDTMGTEHLGDDVVIFADPYDTSDHKQDGYLTYPAPNFFEMWLDSGRLPEDQSKQQWLIAKPAK